MRANSRRLSNFLAGVFGRTASRLDRRDFGDYSQTDEEPSEKSRVQFDTRFERVRFLWGVGRRARETGEPRPEYKQPDNCNPPGRAATSAPVGRQAADRPDSSIPSPANAAVETRRQMVTAEPIPVACGPFFPLENRTPAIAGFFVARRCAAAGSSARLIVSLVRLLRA